MRQDYKNLQTKKISDVQKIMLEHTKYKELETFYKILPKRKRDLIMICAMFAQGYITATEFSIAIQKLETAVNLKDKISKQEFLERKIQELTLVGHSPRIAKLMAMELLQTKKCH